MKFDRKSEENIDSQMGQTAKKTLKQIVRLVFRHKTVTFDENQFLNTIQSWMTVYFKKTVSLKQNQLWNI